MVVTSRTHRTGPLLLLRGWRVRRLAKLPATPEFAGRLADWSTSGWLIELAL